jgi:DNA-binding response OmpR family regulator
LSVEGKCVVVLSDNDLLARAIELNLNGRLNIRVAAPAPGRVAWSEGQAGDVDLIVVALTSQTGEPLVALVRASLAGQIGQVPLLIISDRPFDARPDDQIAHLDFPFHPDELQAKVRGLLQGG